MAIPTITSITPNAGPSVGGHNVVIVGTGFKVPTIVLGNPSTSDVPTVSVTFDGQACSVMKVLSSTQLEVLPPWYRSTTRAGTPPAEAEKIFPVNVVVSNLLAGAVIPGEIVTSVGGYSYTRWVLGPPGTSGAIVGAVEAWVERLRREVCRTVAITRSAEYAEGTGVEVDPARIPSVNMGFRLQENMQLRHENQGRMSVQDPADADRFFVYEGIKTYDMIYRTIVAGDGFREATEMVDALMEGIEVQPYLYTPGDTGLWPTRTYEKNPIFVTQDPELASGVTGWRMVSYSMEIVVQGLRVKPRRAREKIWAIDQFSVWDLGQTLVVS